MKPNKKTKLNWKLLVILAGVQFAFAALADDGAVTNSAGAMAQLQTPPRPQKLRP